MKGWPFNKADCLIGVAFKTGLTALSFSLLHSCYIIFIVISRIHINSYEGGFSLYLRGLYTMDRFLSADKPL